MYLFPIKLKTALVTAASGERGLWVVWGSNDKVRLWLKGSKLFFDRI